MFTGKDEQTLIKISKHSSPNAYKWDSSEICYCRTSHLEVSCEIPVLQNSAKVTRKHTFSSSHVLKLDDIIIEISSISQPPVTTRGWTTNLLYTANKQTEP